MFNKKDRTEKYVLVGLVSGNPLGCGTGDTKERLFPDYHVSVGNEEVRQGTRYISTFPLIYRIYYILGFRVD